MTELSESLLIWGGAALGVFWFVGAYNRLMRLRSAVLQQYAALHVLIMGQVEFVQQEQVNRSTHDTRLAANRGELLAALEQLVSMMPVMRANPLDAGLMAAFRTALNVVLMAWARHVGVGTTVALEPIHDGGLAWPDPSELIEITRMHFNTAVMRYNAAIRQFPALLIASACRFRPAAPLN